MTPSDSAVKKKWSEPLVDDIYVQNRLAPRFWQTDYLAFRDLHAVVQRFARSASGTVFDYGCGGSPYRGLFSHCSRYIGADIFPGPGIDVVLKPEGLTSEPDASVQTVVSFQVLEHVKNPSHYLEEAFRILSPGGILIVTTHGMFLEHGCPDDYFRWTGYGLSQAVRNAGFLVEKAVKITPGARASAHLIHTAVSNPGPVRSPIFKLGLKALRVLYALTCRGPLNILASWIEPRNEVLATSPERIYIGVGVLARKP